MKSGLEGRNNPVLSRVPPGDFGVSMKSGLEGRNNEDQGIRAADYSDRLNEVRPRRPEQCGNNMPARIRVLLSQ